MKEIKNLVLDEERALYNMINSSIIDCKFDGPKDGESAIKEGRNIYIRGCYFNLRYPIWHTYPVEIHHSTMTEFCRAALWYCKNVKITSSKLYGIKALRECNNIEIVDCDIISKEFGWKNDNIKIKKSSLEGEYALFESNNIQIGDIKFFGKYSFQYCKNLTIENSYLDTKDAFWHCENVVVKNSYIKGEYLGWYAKKITFINCTIEGTQPLCYCKDLILKDCKMIETDLAFENSEVEASIVGNIKSVKNPLSGIIVTDSVDEVIGDDTIYDCKGVVRIREQTN